MFLSLEESGMFELLLDHFPFFSQSPIHTELTPDVMKLAATKSGW